MRATRSRDPDLDRSGGRPLYLQIVSILARDIRERRLPAGSVLPSEASLCKRFGVARSVVRQALSVLVAEGAIHREPGRAPTVAARREHLRLVQRSTGLFDQFASTGTALRTRVLRLEPAAAPAEVANFFGTTDVWLLERLRRIDNVPLAFVRTWLPRDRVADIRAESLHDASLHGVLAQHYGIRPGRGRNRIRAVAADEPLATMLEVDPGSPLLMLEGQGMDTEGGPMEWFTTWHRAEQLVFDVEVGPEAEQVQPAMPSDAAAGVPRPRSPDTAEDPLDSLERHLEAALGNVRRLRASR